MPRGVAVPEPRQHLFAAAERVIVRDGPGRLTSRVVTTEAGVATGMLFKHFADFDNFLQGFAVDRSFQVAGAAAGLTARAGTGTVAGNLTDALLATPMTTLQALARVLAYRPDLAAETERILGVAGLPAIERALAGYLAAEQRLGRIPAGADAGAWAFTLVAVLHHAALTGGDPTVVRRTIDLLGPAAGSVRVARPAR